MFSWGEHIILMVVGPQESCSQKTGNGGSSSLGVHITEANPATCGTILITADVFGVLFQDIWIYQAELSQVSLCTLHMLQSHSRKGNVLQGCHKHSPKEKFCPSQLALSAGSNCFKSSL